MEKRRPSSRVVSLGRLAAGALAVGLAACSGGSGDTPDTSGSTTSPPAPTVPDVASPHACGVKLHELSIDQAVKVSLLVDGAPAPASIVPLIAGRRAYFRALVTLNGSSPGNVVARLNLHSSSGVRTLEASQLVEQDSDEGKLSTSLNFDAPADAIAGDTAVSLDLYLGSDCPDQGHIVYPAGDTPLPLSPYETGTLKVKFVPVQYTADGSNRIPDVESDQLQRFHDVLMAYYPTRALDLSVRDPVSSNIALSASDGWDQLLDALRDLRTSDGAPGDVFYYGLVMPATSFSIYCKNSCTAGLSYLATSTSMAAQQVSAGIGFVSTLTGETLVHELGHQHGRAHAPCGNPSGVDPKFPYSMGGIGSWGLDLRGTDPTVQSPADHKDMMGYCEPVWISDYTYAALALRRAQVLQTFGYQVQGPAAGPVIPATSYRSLLLRADGTAIWGRPFAPGQMPEGTPETASVLGADGNLMTQVTVYRTEYGHGLGAHYMVPAPGAGWGAIAVNGGSPLSFAAPASVPALEPVARLPR